MSRRAAHPERRGWPRVALALIGLNLLLTISFSANLPWVRPTATVSPDLLLLVAAAALLGGLSAPRWGRTLLALLLLAAASARIAGLIALELLGRPLDPAGDLPHLGAVAEMLGTVTPALTLGVLLPLAALLLGGLLLLLSAGSGSSPARRTASDRRRTPASPTLHTSAELSPPGVPSAAGWRFTPPHGRTLRSTISVADPELGGADFYVLFLGPTGWRPSKIRIAGPPWRRGGTLTGNARAGGYANWARSVPHLRSPGAPTPRCSRASGWNAKRSTGR